MRDTWEYLHVAAKKSHHTDAREWTESILRSSAEDLEERVASATILSLAYCGFFFKSYDTINKKKMQLNKLM